MKSIRILTVASFLFAVGSAFITMPKHPAAGHYLSKKVNDECVQSTGDRTDCTGSGATCTISGVTYFSDDHCGTALKKN